MKKLLVFFKYFPVHFVFFLLRGFSYLPYDLSYRFGQGLGFLLYLFYAPLRKTARKNIANYLPHLEKKAQKQLCRTSFLHLGVSFVDAAILAFMPKDKDFNAFITEIEGLEKLQASVANKKGVLLLFPHFNDVYMVGYCLLKRLNIPFSVMYHSPRHPVLKQLAAARLRRYCKYVFSRKQIRGMITALQAGNLVWYAPDLNPGRKKGVFAPFFGQDIATHTATMRIAALTKADVFFISFQRETSKKFKIKFDKPFTDWPTGKDYQDAATLNRYIEQLIRDNPTQYLWVYRRTVRQKTDEAFNYDR